MLFILRELRLKNEKIVIFFQFFNIHSRVKHFSKSFQQNKLWDWVLLSFWKVCEYLVQYIRSKDLNKCQNGNVPYVLPVMFQLKSNVALTVFLQKNPNRFFDYNKKAWEKSRNLVWELFIAQKTFCNKKLPLCATSFFLQL